MRGEAITVETLGGNKRKDANKIKHELSIKNTFIMRSSPISSFHSLSFLCSLDSLIVVISTIFPFCASTAIHNFLIENHSSREHELTEKWFQDKRIPDDLECKKYPSNLFSLPQQNTTKWHQNHTWTFSGWSNQCVEFKKGSSNILADIGRNLTEQNTGNQTWLLHPQRKMSVEVGMSCDRASSALVTLQKLPHPPRWIPPGWTTNGVLCEKLHDQHDFMALKFHPESWLLCKSIIQLPAEECATLSQFLVCCLFNSLDSPSCRLWEPSERPSS